MVEQRPGFPLYHPPAYELGKEVIKFVLVIFYNKATLDQGGCFFVRRR
jgi:hypothetical protein